MFTCIHDPGMALFLAEQRDGAAEPAEDRIILAGTCLIAAFVAIALAMGAFA